MSIIFKRPFSKPIANKCEVSWDCPQFTLLGLILVS